MRQPTPGWQVPNFAIDMDWFESRPTEGRRGYSSTDKLEAPFIVPPREDGRGVHARYHLRHRSRRNGGREADPKRQDHLRTLHTAYQQFFEASGQLVTLPPEVMWAFGLTAREHLLLILLWLRRDMDPSTGKRGLSGSGYYATSLMERLCGGSDGKWRDAIASLAKKGVIIDWHFTDNPDHPGLRLCDWKFAPDVLGLLRAHVPTWAFIADPERPEGHTTTPAPGHREPHQDIEIHAGTATLGQSEGHTRTSRATPGHRESTLRQHRPSDLNDVADLRDPEGGLTLTAVPSRGSLASLPGSEGSGVPCPSVPTRCSANKHMENQEPASTEERDSSTLSGPSLEELRDDTFLLPRDFEIHPPDPDPSMSPASKVIKEVVEVIHNRCERNAAKQVVELIDGSWRSRPRVPTKRSVRKMLQERCPEALEILRDDDVRRLTVDRIEDDGRYTVVEILGDLSEWVIDDADRVEGRRQSVEEEFLTRRKEDEAILAALRERGWTTFSDLLRIEDDKETPNCDWIGWCSVSKGDWIWWSRSPVVEAAMRVQRVDGHVDDCRVEPADLAQQIIDANPDAIVAYRRRQDEIQAETNRFLAQRDQEQRDYIKKWAPGVSDAALDNHEERSAYLEGAKRKEAEYARRRESVRRRRAMTPEQRRAHTERVRAVKERVQAKRGRSRK